MTNEQYECVIADLTKQINEQNARIAELEAALNGWQQWWGLPWQDRRPDIAERCYRAALNGEKV